MSNKKKVSWKAKIERGFETLGLAMGKRPWLWLLSCLVMVGAMASQLPQLKKDTSIEGFLKIVSILFFIVSVPYYLWIPVVTRMTSRKVKVVFP